MREPSFHEQPVVENDIASVTLLCAAEVGSPELLLADLLCSSLGASAQTCPVDPANVEASLSGDAVDRPIVLCGLAPLLLKVLDSLDQRLAASSVSLVAVVVFGTETEADEVRRRDGMPLVLAVQSAGGQVNEAIQSAGTRVNDELASAQASAEVAFRAFNTSQCKGTKQLRPWLEQWAAALEEAPATPALIDDSGSLTLGGLHHWGIRVSQALRQRGCARERVVVYLEKCAANVWVAIGCMMCSATFIDVAPWHKGPDLKRILDVAKPSIVVTTAELSTDLPKEVLTQVLTLSEVEELAPEFVQAKAAKRTPTWFGQCCAADVDAAFETVSPAPAKEPGGSFCVLTSGSTGVSKVVRCPQAALTDSRPIFDEVLQPGDRVGSFWLHYYFSCVLFAKCTVIPLSDRAFADAHMLCDQVRKHGVTVLFLTPTFLESCLKSAGREELRDAFQRVHTVMLTGESVRTELRDLFRAALPKARLLNIFSINETGDLAVEDPCEADTFRLRPGVCVSILDSRGLPVLRGAVGQLSVHTRALCREYWTENGTFAMKEREQFATGDLVRWLGDGRISFVGRQANAHVKIRGFKVNLKAVEGVLTQHPQVISAWCTATGTHDQNAKLEAAVRLSSSSTRTVTERELRDWLLDRVPRYMVPAVFRLAEGEVSRTKPMSSGKMRLLRMGTSTAVFNRMAVLGASDAQAVQHELSPEESLVAEAWRKTLGLPLQVLHPEDIFFNLGGSLLLLQLVHVLGELSGGTPPSVNTLLEDSSLAGMARALGGARCATKFDAEAEADKFPLEENSAPPLATPDALASSYRKLSTEKSVFVTGGTGLLGAYLVRSLCRRSEIKTVFCLVRAEDTRSAQARLARSCRSRGMAASNSHGSWFSKVVAVCGDLSAPGLGLSESDRKQIVDAVALVLHIGAEVNWVKPYATLASSNVGGTKEALQLAAEAGASHLFASSITASAAPDQFNSGYRQSKEAAEVLCSRASQQLGVPSAIMRFGDIGAAEVSLKAGAAGALPDNDFMVILIRACVAVRSYPDAPWAISIMGVDQLADWISEVAVGMPASEFKSVPRDVKARLVSWAQFWAWIGGALPVQQCSHSSWRSAIEQGAENGVEAIQRLMLVLPMVEGYLAHEGERLAKHQGSSEELPSIGAGWAHGMARAVARGSAPSNAPCCSLS